MKRIKFGLIICGFLVFGIVQAQESTPTAQLGNKEPSEAVCAGSKVQLTASEYPAVFTYQVGIDSADSIKWQEAKELGLPESPLTILGDTLIEAGEAGIFYFKGKVEINGVESEEFNKIITVNRIYTVTETISICEKELPYHYKGKDHNASVDSVFTAAGIKDIEFKTVNGCDSIVTVTLAIYKNYTVTFDSNGGTEIAEERVCENHIATKPTAPAKTGYSFVAWYADNETFNDEWNFTASMVTQDTTLYAKWKANTYKVTYNGSGNTDGSTAPSIHIYDEENALAKNGFVKTGYVFEGWAIIADGTVTYKDEEKVKNLTEANDTILILYAVWKCKIPTTEIVRKSTSNILICKDTTPGVHYKWGYTDRETGEEKTVAGEYADFQYVDFQHKIDTVKYEYFVEIKYDGVPCSTRTYYPSRDAKTDAPQMPQTPRITAYPNPAKRHLSVTIEKDIEGSCKVLLLNTFGQTVFSGQYAGYRANSIIPLDFNLPRGIYMLIVKAKDEVFTSKIIIE